MTSATDKQIGYMIVLANELTGRTDRFLDQISDVLPFSRSAIRRGITSSEASTAIKHLQAAIKAKGKAKAPEATDPEPEPVAVFDTVTAEDLIGMIGKVVEVTSSVSGNTYRGRAYALRAGSGKNTIGKVVLDLNIVEPGKAIPEIPLANIASWRLV